MRLFDPSIPQVDNENIAAHFRIGIQIRRTGLMGLSVKQIAQATELSEDDVLKLIQK